VDARQCELRLADGSVRTAPWRSRVFDQRGDDRNPIAVGDRVLLEPEADDLAVAEVLPRKNIFCRRGSGEDKDQRQLLAANVDQVLVVSSLAEPPFSSIAADRILVACSFAGIPARLVLNKVDIGAPDQLAAIRATYSAAEVAVHATSATHGEGMAALRDAIAGRISVFYGLSGVGKSTLLNALAPGLNLTTRASSAALGSGRHTTSNSQLYELPGGGGIVDTPGVRKFRPYGLPPSELRLHFPELRATEANCRFADCTHRTEPGCGLRKAVSEGRVPESRFRSYLEILEELESIHGGTGGEKPPGPDHKTRR
jgi:ribosome biogenesis GTPase